MSTLFRSEDDDEMDVDSDDSEDDTSNPCVKTIPIFMAQALAPYATLLQYPHKAPEPDSSEPLLPPSLRDRKDHASRIHARSKPLVGRLELSVPLEIEEGRLEGRFNMERASDMGMDAELRGGKSNSKDSDGGGMPLSKMTLRGEVVPDQTNYCLGVFQKNELHLTPLTQTVQLRPELSYLDNLAARMKREERMQRMQTDPRSDDSDSSEDPDLPASEKKKKEPKAPKSQARAAQVTVKSEGGASGGRGMAFRDQASGRHDGTLFASLRAEEGEPWVALPHYTSATAESNELFEYCFAQQTDRINLLTKTTQHLEESLG